MSETTRYDATRQRTASNSTVTSPKKEIADLRKALGERQNIPDSRILSGGKPSYGNHGDYMRWMRLNYRDDEEAMFEQMSKDHALYEERRESAYLSLQASYRARYYLDDNPCLMPVPVTRGFTPPLSEQVDLDPNINGSERDTLRFIVRTAYRQARETREINITLSYIAKGLGKSVRQIRRHLRALERAGYIAASIVQSNLSKLVVCLRIALKKSVFPIFHKRGWPLKFPGMSEIPGRTFSTDKNNPKYYMVEKNVKEWATLCLNGVSLAYQRHLDMRERLMASP